MVVASEQHGPARDGPATDRPVGGSGVVTHLGCSVLAAALTAGFVLLVGAGTLFAVLSTLGYLSTTAFVWLVLAWWVVWWLAAEMVVGRVRGGSAAGPGGNERPTQSR